MAQRAGRALREKWRMERLADEVCKCGHRIGGHFELRDVLVWDGDDVATARFERHADHVVGEFHCNVDGCDCVVRR